MRHELAHVILKHTGNNDKYDEWNADERGARLAINSGFNLTSYIRALYNEPNSYSPSHGCWHERAKRLEDEYGIDTGLHEDHHEDHNIGTGAFPPTRLNIEVRVQYKHKIACSHRIQWGHRIQCGHVVWNCGQWVRQHQFD